MNECMCVCVLRQFLKQLHDSVVKILTQLVISPTPILSPFCEMSKFPSSCEGSIISSLCRTFSHWTDEGEIKKLLHVSSGLPSGKNRKKPNLLPRWVMMHYIKSSFSLLKIKLDHFGKETLNVVAVMVMVTWSNFVLFVSLYKTEHISK